MSKALSQAVPLSRRVEMTALIALFWLCLRQHCRGRRLILMAIFLSVPAVVAVLVRTFDSHVNLQEFELGVVYIVMPLLAALSSLIYASGMIQDEVEEQTLTYLLVRPLPKWGLYLVKLLATLVMAIALTCLFAAAAVIAVNWGTPRFSSTVIPWGVLKTMAAFAIVVIGYCTLFGATSVLTRRSLLAGVCYVVAFEMVLANLDFPVRKFTIVYYFRILCERWLHLNAGPWSIDLAKAPTAADAATRLMVASLAFLILAIAAFSTREFRVKTPEGS